MSWSNRWIGKRSGIKAAMARYSGTLSGQSKAEFELARPHLEALLDMNTNNQGDPIISLDANGHAYHGSASPGAPPAQDYSQVSVTLQQLGTLCEEPALEAAAPVTT